MISVKIQTKFYYLLLLLFIFALFVGGAGHMLGMVWVRIKREGASERDKQKSGGRAWRDVRRRGGCPGVRGGSVWGAGASRHVCAPWTHLGPLEDGVPRSVPRSAWTKRRYGLAEGVPGASVVELGRPGGWWGARRGVGSNNERVVRSGRFSWYISRVAGCNLAVCT